MHKIIGKIALFTILIGVLALALNTAFGNGTITYLTKVRYDYGTGHFYMYKFDFWPYLKNLQLSTSDLSVLQFNLPTREWQWTGNMNDWFPDIANNLALILDYIIVILNVILYPFKIGAYLLRNVCALIGINTNINDANNGLAWITIFTDNILANFSIPYV